MKDQNRVKELLRILDYMAAPFGSEEYNFLNYGIEGVDSQRDPATGALTLTDPGLAERGDLVYVMAGLPVFYYPNVPGAAEAALKLALRDPQDRAGRPELAALLADQRLQGGGVEPVRLRPGHGDHHRARAADQPGHRHQDWKSRGGDQIRQEFQASLKG